MQRVEDTGRLRPVKQFYALVDFPCEHRRAPDVARYSRAQRKISKKGRGLPVLQFLPHDDPVPTENLIRAGTGPSEPGYRRRRSSRLESSRSTGLVACFGFNWL